MILDYAASAFFLELAEKPAVIKLEVDCQREKRRKLPAVYVAGLRKFVFVFRSELFRFIFPSEVFTKQNSFFIMNLHL